MFSRLREPFGKAGLIVAVVALVAAMVGGAYAADSASTSGKRHHKANHKKKKSKYVITNKKQIKPNVLKQLQGNAGAPGPAGPQGPAGAKGDKGDTGVAGTNGTNGTDGTDGQNGKNGESVTVLSLAAGECNNGEAGAKFISGFEEAEACDGVEGPPGPEGNIKSTLPAGLAMKGTWAANPFTATAAEQIVPAAITLNIPTASVPLVFYLKEGEAETPEVTLVEPHYHYCEGGTGETARVGDNVPSGQTVICIFTKKAVNWKQKVNTAGLIGSVPNSANGTLVKRSGPVLLGESEAAGASYAYGSWVAEVKE